MSWSACTREPLVVLDGSDTPAHEQRTRRQARERLAVTHEMRVVGVARFRRETTERGARQPLRQSEERAEPQDALQGLRAVPERGNRPTMQRARRHTDL